MDPTQTIELAATVIGIGGVVFSAGRFTESVKANTKATEKLAEVIDTHLTWSAEMAREVAEKFHEMDVRLRGLEEKK